MFKLSSTVRSHVAHLKECDIAILLKSQFMRKFEIVQIKKNIKIFARITRNPERRKEEKLSIY
jgi:hypothetical protein